MKGSLPGSFANALNAVLDNGFVALHGGCIGHNGKPHSDLSVYAVSSPSPHYQSHFWLVKGKSNEADLRDETRGQLFNELLRHRSIDFTLNNDPQTDHYYGPILMMVKHSSGKVLSST